LQRDNIGESCLALHLETLDPCAASLSKSGNARSAMRESITVMDAARLDAEGFIEGDLDFDLALTGAAGNPLILSLIGSILGQLREPRMRTYYIEGGPDCGQYHDQRILAAIERRHPQWAVKWYCGCLKGDIPSLVTTACVGRRRV